MFSLVPIIFHSIPIYLYASSVYLMVAFLPSLSSIDWMYFHLPDLLLLLRREVVVFSRAHGCASGPPAASGSVTPLRVPMGQRHKDL
jgi:hypothetical protein